MKLNIANRLYLLSEVFGNDISKVVAETSQKFKESEEFKNLDSYMWMVRIEKGKKDEITRSYLNLNYDLRSYYQAMVLQADVENIVTKSLENIQPNPFIYNPKRNLGVKTIGEMPIYVGDQRYQINEYVIKPDIDVLEKQTFLSSVVEEWCKQISDDIEKGLQANRSFFDLAVRAKKIRQPLLTLFWGISGLVSLAIFLLTFLGNHDFLSKIRSTDDFPSYFSETPVARSVWVAAFLFALLTFTITSIRKTSAHNYKSTIIREIEKNNSQYRASLGKLVKKSAFLQEKVVQAIATSRFVKIPFQEVVVLTPENYQYDTFNRNLNRLKKHYYAKHHRASTVFAWIFFILTLAAVGALVYFYTGGNII
jgi:hypothetical protein